METALTQMTGEVVNVDRAEADGLCIIGTHARLSGQPPYRTESLSESPVNTLGCLNAGVSMMPPSENRKAIKITTGDGKEVTLPEASPQRRPRRSPPAAAEIVEGELPSVSCDSEAVFGKFEFATHVRDTGVDVSPLQSRTEGEVIPLNLAVDEESCKGFSEPAIGSAVLNFRAKPFVPRRLTTE